MPLALVVPECLEGPSIITEAPSIGCSTSWVRTCTVSEDGAAWLGEVLRHMPSRVIDSAAIISRLYFLAMSWLTPDSLAIGVLLKFKDLENGSAECLCFFVCFGFAHV